MAFLSCWIKRERHGKARGEFDTLNAVALRRSEPRLFSLLCQYATTTTGVVDDAGMYSGRADERITSVDSKTWIGLCGAANYHCRVDNLSIPNGVRFKHLHRSTVGRTKERERRAIERHAVLSSETTKRCVWPAQD